MSDDRERKKEERGKRKEERGREREREREKKMAAMSVPVSMSSSGPRASFRGGGCSCSSSSLAASSVRMTMASNCVLRQQSRQGSCVKTLKLGKSSFRNNFTKSNDNNSSKRLEVSCMALSRQGKEAAVQKVQALKERSAMAFSFDYQTMTVAQLESFRRSLPEDSSCLIIKNRLMKLSFQGDEKWEPLYTSGDFKGMNAYVFSPVESIKPTVKAYLQCAKDLKKKDRPPAIIGGVFDGQYLAPADVEKLEDMPTKEELYAKIAGLIKQVPTKLATGVKQVPSKVAYGVKAIADKKEEEEGGPAAEA